MLNNRKKLFKILFIPFSLLICLSIFLFNTFAQVGYEVNDNGNIESLNLFDEELVNGYHSGSNGNLTLISGNLVTNKNLISLSNNTYYTISFVASGIYLDGICYYYSNGSFKSYEQLSNHISPFTFLLSNDEFFISFNFISNSNIDYTQITNVMLNEGQIALDYFPYGNYYTTPQQNNFIKYLIGDNYFSGGRASITQTTNNTYWDREILNSNLYSGYTIGNTRIGNYIVGDTIYIENLTYDLVEGLKATNRYNFNYFTYIHLKPSLNFATSSVEYLSIQCKYVNLTIYAPNSSYTVSAYVGNSSDLPLSANNDRVYFEQLGDYINISFDENDTRYLWDIEIVLNRDDNNFISPQNIISNTDSTISWDMYNIGFDDGVNSMQMRYNILESDYNSLVQQNNSLQSSINVLRQEVDNLENALNNNFGFKNVFFALADTPFKTVSNFLGFELFGIDLFNALVGFITVLACIWLIKKFL